MSFTILKINELPLYIPLNLEKLKGSKNGAIVFICQTGENLFLSVSMMNLYCAKIKKYDKPVW